jgi:hypothetical protein
LFAAYIPHAIYQAVFIFPLNVHQLTLIVLPHFQLLPFVQITKLSTVVKIHHSIVTVAQLNAITAASCQLNVPSRISNSESAFMAFITCQALVV